ncbi:MAG: hypothetical protein PHG03_03570 [Bacilli bacterium]|nr:hypothetical protein [Bacilli bacterium]
MEKKLKILIGILIILVLAGPIFYKYFEKLKEDAKPNYIITNDSLQFESEYESLNNNENSNGVKYLNVNLPSYVPVEYTSYDKIFEILDGGTGVIYFGFPECPWCRNLTPVLADAALDYGLNVFYYISNQDDRNVLSLNKRKKIITDKKGSKDYLKLIELLDDFLPVYRGLNDDFIKRLYFPSVLFVKDGEIIGLEQSLASYTERVDGDPYLPMNMQEKEELNSIFTDYFNKVQPKVRVVSK